MYFFIVANGRRLQTAFPIKLVTNSARFLWRHQYGMWKILPSDWSICTTWSKYSILIGYTLYRQPLLLNCTRNHVVTYTKNVHETFTGFRLAENECICHVTRVQRWNMSANYKQSARCQNLVCLVFERCLFHVYYFVTTWFLVQFLVMEEKKKLLECQSFFEPNSSSLVIAPKADTFDNEVLREKMLHCKVEIWTIWRNNNFGGIWVCFSGLEL